MADAPKQPSLILCEGDFVQHADGRIGIVIRTPMSKGGERGRIHILPIPTSVLTEDNVVSFPLERVGELKSVIKPLDNPDVSW